MCAGSADRHLLDDYVKNLNRPHGSFRKGPAHDVLSSITGFDATEY